MSEPAVSPLAPKQFPTLPPVAGVRLAAAAAGIRYRGRDDVLLALLPPGTAVAGVLTRSRTASAPVDWCRQRLGRGRARALLANAGNANAFTGAAGRAAVEATARGVADAVGCRPGEVFLASTGVIGEPLPQERIAAVLGALEAKAAEGGWRAAADAIRTTDTFAKAAGGMAEIDGKAVGIVGIAKGSGMIAPDMATMLAFLFTDARLPGDVLQAILAPAADRTFNSITVDGDTSTSDTVLLFATGAGERHPRIAAANDPRLRGFKAALEDVMADLARQIVRDGEGASKFIEIRVTGAASATAARRIALAVGNSPLVKTAFAGGDANWGRIVMAVGKAGEKADRDRLTIRIGGVLVAEKGWVHPDYREAQVADHMQGQEIDVEIDVGIGRGRARIWTCDLTHGYISINADYRS